MTKFKVNQGKYDGQYGTITSVTASSTRSNAILTYNVQLIGDAFLDSVPFVSKNLKKVEAFPQQYPADLDDPSPVPTAKKRKTTASKVGGSFASGGMSNSAMPIEVFGNCDEDGEEEEEQNVVDEVFVHRSGVKDADSPRHVTIQTKTTPLQSIKWTESAVTGRSFP